MSESKPWRAGRAGSVVESWRAGRRGDRAPEPTCASRRRKQRSRSRSPTRKETALPQAWLTSLCQLKRIRSLIIISIDKAAEEYSKRRRGPKTVAGRIAHARHLYYIVAHTVNAIHDKFGITVDDPQSEVQPESTPTLEVYLGWLIKQADLECVEIPLLKERLIQFAEAEHWFLRMQLLVQKAQSMGDQLDQEAIVDRCALKHSLRFFITAVEKAREAFFSLVASTWHIDSSSSEDLAITNGAAVTVTNSQSDTDTIPSGPRTAAVKNLRLRLLRP